MTTATTIQLLAGLGLFLLGLLMGSLLARGGKKEAEKSKRLAEKLSETEDAYRRYQADVSSHFLDTARKVQNLNNSYREVHEQLAKSANTLCSEEEAKDFIAISLDRSSKANSKTISDFEHSEFEGPDFENKELEPQENGALAQLPAEQEDVAETSSEQTASLENEAQAKADEASKEQEAQPK